MPCPFLSFGKLPSGDQQRRVNNSPQFVNGQFVNQIETPLYSEKVSFWASIKDLAWNKNKRIRPKKNLPMEDINFKTLDTKEDCIIWLGHSSYYLQLNGKRILIDPVLVTYASPLRFINKSFDRTYAFSPEKLPEIDVVLISHDHWDHLDYPTLKALQSRIQHIVVPVGVDAHLLSWGFVQEKIHVLDWYESWELTDSFLIHAQPARHFSGRWIKRNQTLWVSYMIETPQRRIFYSGDTGYSEHFSEIAKRFNNIDIAIMENGQYNKNWAYVHMNPEQTAKAGEDIKAKVMIPAHSGRFALAPHAWDNPLVSLAAASKGKPYTLLTPQMGEIVFPDRSDQTFSPWWEEVED